MAAALTLARRLRANVTSLGDLALLARVTVIMGVMPLLLRLPVPRVLRWLDAASRLVAVDDPARAARVVRYCHGLGGLRVWAFQDNCVARSLALFALLNRHDDPLDVVFGVRVTVGPDGGVTLGRRHVWLERQGEPLLETEPIAGYVVSMRYRDPAAVEGTADERPATAERRLAWGATIAGAVATGVVVVSGAAKAKLVAVALGPAAIGLLGQQATLATLLSYLASFGTSAGTSRFLSEALAAGDTGRAGTVVRTSMAVQAWACLAVIAIVGAFASPLATLAFGRGTSARWLLWLLPAVPLTGLATMAAAVLRGHRLALRHAVAQAAAALAGLVVAAVLVRRGDARVVLAFPALVAGGQALVMTVAAWPRLRDLWRAAATRVDVALARQVASYGVVHVAMAACTAGATVMVGRLLLARGTIDDAGLYYALVAGADVLLNLILGGYQAHYYPTFCAAAAGRSAWRVFGRLVRTVTWFTVAILIAPIVAAPRVVTLLLSTQFTAVVPLVGAVAIGVYGRMLGAMFGIPFLARGHLAVVGGLHALWSLALVAACVWLGVDGGPASWAHAFAIVSGLHACVMAASAHWWLHLRLDVRTWLVITVGALLVAAMAR